MSATKFRFTEQAIEKLSGSEKRARYYDSQVLGLIIDFLPSNKKTFRVLCLVLTTIMSEWWSLKR